MKETLSPLPAGGESAEHENFANRKLIRPTLPRPENHGNQNSNHTNHGGGHSNHGHSGHSSNHGPVQLMPGERRERHERVERSDRPAGGGGAKKFAPPEQTNAENFYYQKQMQSRTQMVIVLRDGEEIRGVIEWYDKSCIKVNRDGGDPNLLIYKPAIKYMYKESEDGKR
jgi:host factor-I protein